MASFFDDYKEASMPIILNKKRKSATTTTEAATVPAVTEDTPETANRFSRSLVGETIGDDDRPGARFKRRKYATNQLEEDIEDGPRHFSSYLASKRTATQGTPFPDEFEDLMDLDNPRTYLYPLASGKNILDDRIIGSDEFTTDFVDPDKYGKLPAADQARARDLAEEAKQEDEKHGLVTRKFMNHVILRQKLLHNKPVYRLVVEKFGSQINLTLPESLIDHKIFQTTLRNIEGALRRELQTLDQTEKRKAAQKELIEENMKTFQEEQDVWNQLRRAKQMQWLSFTSLTPPSKKPEKFTAYGLSARINRAIDVIFKPVSKRPDAATADPDASLMPEQRALLDDAFPFTSTLEDQLTMIRVLTDSVRTSNPNGLPAMIQYLKSAVEKATAQTFTGTTTERVAKVRFTLNDLGVVLAPGEISSTASLDELRQFFERKLREKAKETLLPLFESLVQGPDARAKAETFYKETGQRRGIFNKDEITSLPIAIYLTKWIQYVTDIQRLPQRFDDAVASEKRDVLLDYDNKRKLIQRLRAQIPTVYASTDTSDLSWLETSALEDFDEGKPFRRRPISNASEIAAFDADIAYVEVVWNFITNSAHAFDVGESKTQATAQLNNIPTSSTLYLLTRDVMEIYKQMKSSQSDATLDPLRASIKFSPFIGRFDVFGNMKEVPPNIASLYGNIETALQMNSLRTSLDPVLNPVQSDAYSAVDSTTTTKKQTSSTSASTLEMPSDSRALCQKWLFDFSSFVPENGTGRRQVFLSIASQYVHSLFMPSNISLTELARLSLRLTFFVTSTSLGHTDPDMFDSPLSKMLADFEDNLKNTEDLSPNALSFIRKMYTLEPCVKMLIAFHRAVQNQYHVYEDIRIAIIYGLLLHEIILSTLHTFLSVVSESKLTDLAELRATQRQLLLDMSTGKLYKERNELEKKLEHIINKESTLTDPTNTQVMFFIPLVKQVFSKAEAWVRRNGPVLMNSPAAASWKWTSLVRNEDTVNENFTDVFVSIAAWIFSDVEYASARRILTQVNKDKHHRIDDQQLRIECTAYSLKPGESIPRRVYY